MSASLFHYNMLAGLVFLIGLAGILKNRQNIIGILISLELLLLAVNINFVAFSAFYHHLAGQIFSLCILTVAAAEAAIGLALLVVYFRQRKNIRLDHGITLKG